MLLQRLPNVVLYRIMFYLTTKEVLKCMEVCKHFQTVLSDKYFWKKFLHWKFDLELSTEEYDGPLYQWANPDIWACYFTDKESKPYVLQPFPVVWKCGVIVPAGLETHKFFTKHVQGLCRALEILVKMRKGIKDFHLDCGNQCSPNEGSNQVSVVLFPWLKEGLPNATELLTEIFHFHPEICSNAITTDYKEKMYYHLIDDNKHDFKIKPCLNQVFGLSSYWQLDQNEILEYFSWLQNIMVPVRRVITGEMKLNPVVEFFVTNLGPGWVGGALTGQYWT